MPWLDTGIRGTLQSILEQGQLPICCPGCRSESTNLLGRLAGRQTEASIGGEVPVEALSFFQLRGVLSRPLLFRLVNASRSASGESLSADSFACPADCGLFLLRDHPSYHPSSTVLGEVGLGQMFSRRGPAGLRLGKCECGALICLACETVVPTQDAHVHVCKAGGEAMDPATQALIARIAKPCPGCGTLCQKTDGCQLMFCGTSAHGKVADALKNGGCGYIWHWDTGDAIIDNHGYTGLDGELHIGEGPTTERQTLKRYCEHVSEYEQQRAAEARQQAHGAS